MFAVTQEIELLDMAGGYGAEDEDEGLSIDTELLKYSIGNPREDHSINEGT